MVDIFGDILDVDTVERWLLATLQAWLPAHLKHQERRMAALGRPLPVELPRPRSWPRRSEFDIEVHEQLPAVIVVSAGSVGRPERDRNGMHDKTWRFDTVAVVTGKDEPESRQLGSLYLAAIGGALTQNRTLDGHVASCIEVGPDEHAYGTTRQGGAQRAIYGTTFEVAVRNVRSERLGPDEPPVDPDDPPDAPAYELDTPQIAVTSTPLEETL